MWLFRETPSRNTEAASKKDITKRMDEAIETLKRQEEYHKNAIRSRAIRHLESRLDEITGYMLEHMEPENYCMRIHSKVYSISDVLGIEDEPFGNPMMIALKGKDNIFGQFLCKNKLTMATNADCTKVNFAYGDHSMFKSGWIEWAGYNY